MKLLEGGEHCAMINKSAKLNDSKCSKKHMEKIFCLIHSPLPPQV